MGRARRAARRSRATTRNPSSRASRPTSGVSCSRERPRAVRHCADGRRRPDRAPPRRRLRARRCHRGRPTRGAARSARIHQGTPRSHRWAHHPGLDRSPQPPRLQHPPALGRPRRSVPDPLPMAGRGDVSERRVEPGSGARHRRPSGGTPLCRGQGRRRRGDGDSGLAARHACLSRLDVAQRREGGDRDQAPDLPVGAAGHGRATRQHGGADGRGPVVHLPPRRGRRRQVARRVHLPQRPPLCR